MADGWPDEEAQTREPNLPLLAAFGALGLIPFWAPLAGAAFPGWTNAAGLQTAYGGLILSFLGGVRLGRVLTGPTDGVTTTLSMAPSIVGLGVAALPAAPFVLRYGLLITGLILMWLWDISSKDLPTGYRRLRTPLTVMAVAALALGAALLRQT